MRKSLEDKRKLENEMMLVNEERVKHRANLSKVRAEHAKEREGERKRLDQRERDLRQTEIEMEERLKKKADMQDGFKKFILEHNQHSDEFREE